MNHLLDVDFLTACAWRTHERHRQANHWLNAQDQFFTCPATEMGFLRVSMSPAYRIGFAEARLALADICSLPSHRFIEDATAASTLPTLSSRHEISDAHLVTLAASHALMLATLDEPLCRAHWARGIAVNPLAVEAAGSV